MSKSPWGGIGAWAAEAEREEAEEKEAAAKAASDSALLAAQLGGGASVPSLKDSVNSKQKKKTKMTLHEFRMHSADAGGSASRRGLTAEEMMGLPTGPKERSFEEMQYGRLGGGFSNYGTRPGPGGSGPGMGRGREYEGQGGRRSYGFEDDNTRGRNQSRVSEFSQQQQPSRADGVESWGSMKKSMPEYDWGMPHSGGKYSSLGGNAGVGGSRADEVDNWVSGKKPISEPQQHQHRSSSFGSGFSRPEPERWTRNEGQRLVMGSPKNEVEAVVKANKPNPFGVARPREEVLAEKGLDWKKLEMDLEVKKQQHSINQSRPSSSHSSRPGSSHSNKSEVPISPGIAEVVGKQKPKVNPFGDAKPREIILEEKGLDWKKIDLDLEHRRVVRSQTEDEKNLKEEIERLNKELLQKSGEGQTSANEVILRKQQELDLLSRQIDDNVWYSQNISERHGSGDNRGAAVIHDRPPSRPGSGYHDRSATMPGVYEENRTGPPERRHSQFGMYEDPRARFSEIVPQAGVYGDPRTGCLERAPTQSSAYEYPRTGFSERPHSRSGSHEDPRAGFSQLSSYTPGTYQDTRAVNHGERPRSQVRPGDNRKVFQGGGGGRGFLGNRDVDRSGSRW